jgi:NAD(P)-dependent dehydrogenase (short-subunit alcohol dehydrogenase family)
LGSVIARVLAGRGFDLVLGARDAETLHALAEALVFAGGRIRLVAGDVADVRTRERLVAEARELGRLDVLVNNASRLGGIEALDVTDLDRVRSVFETNALAPLGLIQAALPLLTTSRGLIVNVTSDAAQGAYPGWGAYGSSKAALELFSRTLAAELDGVVSVVAVDPGDMRTRMHQEAFPGQDISDRPLPDVTAPFWHWLFEQPAAALNGRRFAAQEERARWLQPA